jgi:hypothetical protein
MGLETVFHTPLDTTLINLHDLSMFNTTGEVSNVPGFLSEKYTMVTLWLEKSYPIHVEDIHKLIGLSMEGRICNTRLLRLKEAQLQKG